MISGHRDLSSEAMLFIFFTIISTTSPAFGSVRKIFCILFLIRSAIYYRNYVALTWPSSDTTCAHYLFLRFLPVGPSLFLSGKRPRTNTTKLRSTNGINTIANGDNGIKLVKLSIIIFAISGSVSEFPTY